jgi:protein-tyrosine-phosphatase
MPKQNVLFICVHDIGRSEIATALLNKVCEEHCAQQKL